MAGERASGRDFEPGSVEVYGPSRTAKVSGEAYATPMLILTTRIKSPRGLYVSERQNQGHAFAVGDQVIECRSEHGGDALTSDCYFLRRGVKYFIKGVLGQDYTTGTTRYQVTNSNDYR